MVLIIKKALKKDQSLFDKTQKQTLLGSYYETEKMPVDLGKINNKDYFIFFNNKVIGLLRMGESNEFCGRYGIGFVGLVPLYRGKGLSRKIISFCKKMAQKNGITDLLLSVPKKSKETRKIFEKLGFKNKEIRATIVFNDCYFMSLSREQQKYLDLSKRTGLLEWQIMSQKIN